MTLPASAHIILSLTCPDRPGILATVSPALASDGWDIREAGPDTQTFFVRMELAGSAAAFDRLPALLTPLAETLGIRWHVADMAKPLKLLIAVSKTDHCLNDLIHKCRIGSLPIEIVGAMSNHETCRATVEWHGLRYHHLPVTPETRPAQEDAFLQLVDACGADLVVLARYMQILSNGLSSRLSGRFINIHHSFLPSFRGATPYHQAHKRGVKLIGATAHYVAEDLDEGPIIEQDIRRVTHSATAEERVALGQETEASVLSRAVKWHAERRVFLNGQRTVVFA